MLPAQLTHLPLGSFGSLNDRALLIAQQSLTLSACTTAFWPL